MAGFRRSAALLFLLSAAAATAFAFRTLKAAHPVVELSTLGARSFAIGCALSFCLGVGLFGSVYLMPVFLAYVRHHDAFEIGTIMLVTGVAQLVTAPIAGALESRFDPRWLSAAGFALFALGLGCSALQSRVADFDEMFWPQVLRGVAIMFCLLPPTRLALGTLTAAQVPDASGLFNLMRNLGGAIGIALIDTILYGRTGGHADALRDRLIAGDVTAAQAIGLDLQLFTAPAARRVGRHRRGLSSPDGREGGVCAQHQRSLGPARLRGAARTVARSVRGTATAKLGCPCRAGIDGSARLVPNRHP